MQRSSHFILRASNVLKYVQLNSQRLATITNFCNSFPASGFVLIFPSIVKYIPSINMEHPHRDSECRLSSPYRFPWLQEVLLASKFFAA